MSYQARISANNPMAIVIMIDQSGSMSEQIRWNNTNTTKAIAVSEVINTLLSEFISRSRSETAYRHYYDIMIVGYSGGGVKSLIDSGASYFLSPSQLVGSVKDTRTIQRQRQLPDGRRVLTSTQQRIWIDVAAEGRTPMRAAFTTVHHQLRRWIAHHPDAFPPIVINITDGEATDGSPDQIRDITSQIKSLATTDGNTLIMNVHLSDKSEKSIIFPHTIDDLCEDQYARLIYDISSPMPPVFQQEISQQHHQTTTKEYRGMAYNASISDLVRLITIGSTTINQNVTT